MSGKDRVFNRVGKAGLASASLQVGQLPWPRTYGGATAADLQLGTSPATCLYPCSHLFSVIEKACMGSGGTPVGNDSSIACRQEKEAWCA